MEKVLRCRDAGADCDYVICGKSEEEIFLKAKDHAKSDHNLSEIPQDMMNKARLAIREEDHCPV